MKIFKAEQVRQADAYTIKHEPISSIDLMERAARKISDWLIGRYRKEDAFAIFVGPGNNGGDGLVIACHLIEKGYSVHVFDLGISQNYSEDFLINKTRLLKTEEYSLTLWNDTFDLSTFDVVIDAIFGSGLTRPIGSEIGNIIDQINQSNSAIIAVDIPSGLFAEDNTGNPKKHIIKANHTLTFQFPKLAFLLSENEAFVGEMQVFNIGVHPDFIRDTASPYYFTEREDIPKAFLRRKNFSHKGTYGHALIFAGSHGKMGASILACSACLRTGVGLLSSICPKDENLIMQTSLPELMTYPISNKKDIPELQSFNALGLGPGIGTDKQSLEILSSILEQLEAPAVFDADALNLISQNSDLLKEVPEKSIFTPHPKELERLIGKTGNHYTRLIETQKLAVKHQVYILIKGAYSVIVTPENEFHFNTTGNPGMATAGSEDVLTGIITGLLAQSFEPFEALRTGVYIHGLAGDLAQQEKGEISLIASDIVNDLGKAFEELGV